MTIGQISIKADGVTVFVVLVGLDALLPIHGMLVLLQKKPKARHAPIYFGANVHLPDCRFRSQKIFALKKLKFC
jgi:hypothetical protein